MDSQPSGRGQDRANISFKNRETIEAEQAAQDKRLSSREYILQLMLAHQGKLQNIPQEMAADLADVEKMINRNRKGAVIDHSAQVLQAAAALQSGSIEKWDYIQQSLKEEKERQDAKPREEPHVVVERDLQHQLAKIHPTSPDRWRALYNALEHVLGSGRTLRGSQREYSYADLKGYLDKIKTGELPVSFITNANTVGLRDLVEKMLEMDKKTIDQEQVKDFSSEGLLGSIKRAMEQMAVKLSNKKFRDVDEIKQFISIATSLKLEKTTAVEKMYGLNDRTGRVKEMKMEQVVNFVVPMINGPRIIKAQIDVISYDSNGQKVHEIGIINKLELIS